MDELDELRAEQVRQAERITALELLIEVLVTECGAPMQSRLRSRLEALRSGEDPHADDNQTEPAIAASMIEVLASGLDQWGGEA